MKKFFLFITILIVFASTLFAQTKSPVDSLLRALDKDQPDSVRMQTLHRLGDYYSDNNAGKAIEFYEKAKDIAIKENLTAATAANYYSLGFCYLLKSDFGKSLYNYQQSTYYYEKMNDKRRLSNAFMSIGNVYFENKDINNTNLYYHKAEQLVLALKDTDLLASLYDTRGIQFDQLGKYDTALDYMQKALVLERAMHMDDYVSNTLSNIGLNYKHRHQTAEALVYFDSVKIYFEKNNAPADQKASLYNNIAATYAQAKNYSEAISAFHTSIQFAKDAGVPAIEMENYRNMSDMYHDMNNYAQEAFFLKKYYNFKDSLFSSDNKIKLTELESNYQLEKKNTELVKKDAEVSLQKSRQRVLIIVVLAILLLLAVLAFFYWGIKNKNSLLEQKNVQISEQKNELQTLNHVKDRLFSIISHDLRNPLVTLRSYLELSDHDSLAADKKQLFKLQTMNAVSQTGDMLDNLLAWANVQIRNTRANITPVNIEDLVHDALDHVASQARQKQIQISEDTRVNLLPGDYDILLIALRNLLTNAIKYSATDTRILVDVFQKDKEILISVQDEGVGLSTEQVSAILSKQNNSTAGTGGEKGSGLGLFLVQELLQKINASLSIESEAGQGSRFIISVPAF